MLLNFTILFCATKLGFHQYSLDLFTVHVVTTHSGNSANVHTDLLPQNYEDYGTTLNYGHGINLSIFSQWYFLIYLQAKQTPGSQFLHFHLFFFCGHPLLTKFPIGLPSLPLCGILLIRLWYISICFFLLCPSLTLRLWQLSCCIVRI